MKSPIVRSSDNLLTVLELHGGLWISHRQGIPWKTACPQCSHSGRTLRNETVWHQSPRARPATMT